MPAKTRLATLAGFLLAASVVGCKDRSKTAGGPPPATVPAGRTAQTYEGVTFWYPSEWSSAPSQDGKGHIITAPAPDDADWPPSVFLLIADDPGPGDLQKAVDEAVQTLPNRRDQFVAKDKQVLTHPAGFRYGRVEYTSESGGVPLTQWEILVPVPGGKRLVVHANAATADWPKFQPAFAEIVDSIRLPGKP